MTDQPGDRRVEIARDLLVRLQAVAIAAQSYFYGYCQDEADDDGPDFTGCTQEQHEAARALQDALAEYSPSEVTSSLALPDHAVDANDMVRPYPMGEELAVAYAIARGGWSKLDPPHWDDLEPEVRECFAQAAGMLVRQAAALLRGDGGGGQGAARSCPAGTQERSHDAQHSDGWRDLLIEARTGLFALCEDTMDTTADALTTPGLTEHELGYLRGRKVEAKAISRAMQDVFRELLDRLSSSEAPPISRAEGAAGNAGLDDQSPPNLSGGAL